MALTGTTTELLEAIRDDARLASDDPSATDTILLREATRILHKTYAPAVRKARSDYYLTTARIALEPGRASYSIPRRAVTSSIRRVRVLDSSRRAVAQLQQNSIEDLDGTRTGPVPAGYALSDASIVVWPTPNAATHTLEVMFEYRPGSLILPAAAIAQVAGVARNSVSGVWAVFTEDDVLDDGDVIDIIRADSPFSVPVMDAVVDGAAVSGFGFGAPFPTYTGDDPVGVTGLLWTTSSPIGVSPGDWICNAGESPIPQIPLELHPSLAMHTAAKFLIPIDPEGAAQLQTVAQEDMISVLEAMTPRKQGQQQKMRPRVRHVMTNGGWGRRGGGTFGDIG